MKTPALAARAVEAGAVVGQLGGETDTDLPEPAGSAPLTFSSDALRERADRFRLRLEQTVPPQLAFRFAPGSVAAGRLLSMIFDRVEQAGDGILKLHHGCGLPPVMFYAATGRWWCTSGWVEGTGVLELATWARDRELIGSAALAYCLRPVLSARAIMREAA